MSVQELFDPTILNKYSDAIGTKLAGHTIMTKCDYLAYAKPPTTFLNLYTLIDNTKDLCTGVIPYAKSCLTSCLIGDKQCDKYNALFLVDLLTKSTLGFVIVEKGECKDKPNTISIKLICSSFKGGGHILLGAVAYCIKHHLPKVDDQIILDLAGGLLNDRAYKSYMKFGFVVQNIRSNTCFPTGGLDNLIMLLDLRGLGPDIIVYKVLGVPTDLMNTRNTPHVSEEPEPLKRNRNNGNENTRATKRRGIGGKIKKTRRARRRRTRTRHKN
jgi:hypothetical protein